MPKHSNIWAYRGHPYSNHHSPDLVQFPFLCICQGLCPSPWTSFFMIGKQESSMLLRGTEWAYFISHILWHVYFSEPFHTPFPSSFRSSGLPVSCSMVQPLQATPGAHGLCLQKILTVADYWKLVCPNMGRELSGRRPASQPWGLGLIPNNPEIEPGVVLSGFIVSIKKGEAGEPRSQCQACLSCLVSPRTFRDLV